MFFEFGRPLKLDSVNFDPMPIQELKRKFQILIIDDNPPPMLDTLRRSGFNVRDIRDIETIETVEQYPIVACDIGGIGGSFRPGSHNGGLYVLKEIRKYYPDKFLIQYSTKPQNIDSSLTNADVIFPKDTGIEAWQEQLEKALMELGNPKKRWMKIRRRLSDDGYDSHQIFKLEQAYIKSIQTDKPEYLKSDSLISGLSPELKKLITNFAITTISMGIKEMLKP